MKQEMDEERRDSEETGSQVHSHGKPETSRNANSFPSNPSIPSIPGPTPAGEGRPGASGAAIVQLLETSLSMLFLLWGVGCGGAGRPSDPGSWALARAPDQLPAGTSETKGLRMGRERGHRWAG